MIDIQEKKVFSVSGWLVVLIDLAIAVWFILTVVGVSKADSKAFPLELLPALIAFFLACLSNGGFFVIHPNEAKVFTFLGKYVGSTRDAGFYWTNPFVVKKKISLRIYNFNSQTIKVNDALGNPIEIGAVVVWHPVDTAKALFNVDNYQNFVAIQSETAIRQLASHYPYDAHVPGQESLRANPDDIAAVLKDQVQARLEIAGLHIVEARISHLAYAQEIAQSMLRRQQAEAIIAARRQIVDGAVGMVEMALTSLESSGLVKLDDEKRAAMVNNLLVALVSESEAQPVINTGTLYT